MGEGDDALSAALFVLLALDLVQIGPGRVSVMPGLVRANDLPTPFGRIDVQTDEDGQRIVVGRWQGRPPRVFVVETGTPQG